MINIYIIHLLVIVRNKNKTINFCAFMLKELLFSVGYLTVAARRAEVHRGYNADHVFKLSECPANVAKISMATLRETSVWTSPSPC